MDRFSKYVELAYCKVYMSTGEKVDFSLSCIDTLRDEAGNELEIRSYVTSCRRWRLDVFSFNGKVEYYHVHKV